MILVIGASGFLGEQVVAELVRRGERPVCFVREASDLAFLRTLDVTFRKGDLKDLASVARALEGAGTLINITNLDFGHMPRVLEACRVAGVRRGVFIGTTAMYTTLKSEHRASRQQSEQSIAESRLDWTIIRPTMIYGTERDRNMARLIEHLARWPVIPVFGAGRRLQQPVHVEDVAGSVAAAATSAGVAGRSYNVSGKDPISFNEIIDTTARALGRRVARVHLPLPLALAAVRVQERLLPRPLIKTEQVLRLNEDKAFPHDEAARDLGFAPRTFEDGIRAEVARMRDIGLIA